MRVFLSLSFQFFKSLHVQLEMRRKQLEQSLQSTQRDGILTVDQALVKQAWERVSNTVREAGGISRIFKEYEECIIVSHLWSLF